jgi:hypothetical protein
MTALPSVHPLFLEQCVSSILNDTPLSLEPMENREIRILSFKLPVYVKLDFDANLFIIDNNIGRRWERISLDEPFSEQT